ncbi:MAG: hypothetical protein HZC51_09550 [Nitrospirae bacterium]|nr:hypothetical protein [Nitrospirota bacterium]
MKVADGTTTDASGRFTFDHLGEEEYVLLLSVDTSGGKKYRVLNSPGPLKVSEKNPAADAGTINVVMN